MLMAMILPLIIILDIKFNIGMFKIVTIDAHSDNFVITMCYILMFIYIMFCSLIDDYVVTSVKESLEKGELEENILVFKIILVFSSTFKSVLLAYICCKNVPEGKSGIEYNQIYTPHVMTLIILVSSLLNSLKYLDFTIKSIEDGIKNER